MNNITSFKGGMKRKMKKAAMNTSYTAEVLEGAELVFEDLPAAQ
ncbi:hypothetical protein [Parendozoicomonas callyspongiae]|nr:hypothetical protein [Sansalvadorimonas sp. 2012CJ34-2]